MTALYFDCFSGASGDMILGALIDAGVTLEDVRQALGSLAITAGYDLDGAGGSRRHSATKFSVRGEAHPASMPTHHHGTIMRTSTRTRRRAESASRRCTSRSIDAADIDSIDASS